MKKLHPMMILIIFTCMSVIAVPGATMAASLDQYLNSDMGNLVNFRCDVSGPEIIPVSSVAANSGGHAVSMGKMHKYMGYSTLIAAGAAAVTGGDNSFHKGAGDATAALAVVTCITGFIEYGSYFDTSEGMSPYNVHMVLATIATVGFVATAVDANSNEDTGHAGLGIGSGILMLVPVVVLHF